VRLTDAGRNAIDEAMTRHSLTEHRVVSALDDEERARLRGLLHKLLRAVDDPTAASTGTLPPVE
jgi:DNA-binding MarR family transcriptional regulator